jgi:hypothetical protein
MTVADSAWERIRANPSAPRGSFLSMLDWKEQWIDGEKFPFTPSVVDMHGIEAACDELLEEGLETSIARHDVAARACRAGIRAMGLDLWPRSEQIAAACVTAVAVPDGLTDQLVRDQCRARYGVMISGGQGAGNLVRIGHMGPSARSLYPVVGLAALGRTLIDLGVPVRIGDGLEAALEALAARRFVEHASPADVEELHEALHELERLTAEGVGIRAMLNAKDRFYDVLLRGSRNRAVHEILAGLKARVGLLRTHSLAQPGRAKRSVREIRAIVDAVRVRDADAAARACAHHVEQAARAGLKGLAE